MDTRVLHMDLHGSSNVYFDHLAKLIMQLFLKILPQTQPTGTNTRRRENIFLISLVSTMLCSYIWSLQTVQHFMLYLSLFPIGEDDPHRRLYMFRLLMGKKKSSFHIADERACQYWRQILTRKLNWESTQQYFFVVVLTTHKSLSLSLNSSLSHNGAQSSQTD